MTVLLSPASQQITGPPSGVGKHLVVVAGDKPALGIWDGSAYRQLLMVFLFHLSHPVKIETEKRVQENAPEGCRPLSRIPLASVILSAPCSTRFRLDVEFVGAQRALQRSPAPQQPTRHELTLLHTS